jgi:hypothetical protein
MMANRKASKSETSVSSMLTGDELKPVSHAVQSVFLIVSIKFEYLRKLKT